MYSYQEFDRAFVREQEVNQYRDRVKRHLGGVTEE